MATYPVLEHREGPGTRWLRDHRIRVALALAIVETVLVATDVIGWFWAVAFAALVFALHFFLGRKSRYRAVRELSWIAAIAQTLPVLIPFLFVVSLTLFVLAVVAVAAVVLAIVVFGRR